MKIFGIGMNRTGTRSLTAACKILGLTSLHNIRDVGAMYRAMHEHQAFFCYLPRYMRRVESFFDVGPIVWHFDYLDREFPGSKFILHTRDLESWIASRERMIRDSKAHWPAPNPELWTQEWHDHHARVRTYFADRPGDLLEIDVIHGDGWNELCPFLGRGVPDVAFPWIGAKK